MLGLVLALSTGCGQSLRIYQQDRSPDGRCLVIPEGTYAVVRLAENGNLISTLSDGCAATVHAAQFSWDGRQVITGDDQGRIVIWNPLTGGKLRVLEGHEGSIRNLALRQQLPELASASDDGTVRLWDLNSGKESRCLRGHEKAILAVAFSPDGTHLASASRDHSARIWDLTQEKEPVVLRGHEKALRSVRFRPDGNVLATGADDGSIRLWDVKIGQELLTLHGAKGPVVDLQWTRNGAWLAGFQFAKGIMTKRFEGLAGLWNPTTGEQVVVDYERENTHAPADWPYRAVFDEIAHRVAGTLR